MSSEQLYLAHASTIEGAIRFVCRRHRLPAVDAEELAATVRLKLVEDDYAVLRKFQHRSSLRTFLITVVSRCYLDYRNAQWGKWRPSAEARRRGDVAVELEKLLVRDGLKLDEAAEVLRTSHGTAIDDAVLAELREHLPLRAPRRFVAEETLENMPAPPAFSADTGVSQEERASLGRSVAAALGAAVGRLDPPDRLLVRLRFYDGVTVADIARLQRVEQKPLYRRLEGILGRLKAALREAGFHESAIADVLREGELACD